MTPSAVALIPARAGSRRVADKNVRPLGGHPLLAYAIASALESGVFADVIVSTDSERYAAIARHYGARVPFLRPAEFATETAPDIGWVRHALKGLAALDAKPDCLAILRPTSPFRQAATIRRAWSAFLAEPGVDSLRAVEKVSQHPGKMWVVRGRRMLPLLPLSPPGQPFHSSQMAALPEVYVQNASLEIAWTGMVEETDTIAGTTVMPFFTSDAEGFDINTEDDFATAERLLATRAAALPAVWQPPFFG